VTVSALRVGPTLVLLPPLVCAPERAYYDRSAKLESEEATYRVLEQGEPVVASLLAAADTLAANLDFDGAVRIDFVVARGVPYFLEINTAPGMQRRSNFALSAEAAGIDYPMLLGAVLSSAFSSRKVVPWRTPTTSHSFASTIEGRSA
jgi:D-alanine-D-alanine ligase